MERTSDKSPESQESATGLYTGQKWIIENRPQISLAAQNGISWGAARWAFDLYQGRPEGRSTVSAELYGYIVLGNNTPVQRVLRQLRKK